MVFFYRVTTGWISDIGLFIKCENSIKSNQSIISESAGTGGGYFYGRTRQNKIPSCIISGVFISYHLPDT